MLESKEKNNLFITNRDKPDSYYKNAEKSKTAIFRKKIELRNIFLKTYKMAIENNKKQSIFKDKLFLNKIYSTKDIVPYKIKFNNYQKKELDLNNDFKTESNKSSILSPTNSHSPFFFNSKNLLITKVDSKDLLNRNLSISPINKTISSSNKIIKSNSEDAFKNKIRYKTFYVENDPNWYYRNKFIKNRIDKNMVKNPLFQKKIVDDELALIFENMKIFQSQYLIDKNLSKYFNKLSWYTQKSLNSNLEESVGLLAEIGYLLLNEY